MVENEILSFVIRRQHSVEAQIEELRIILNMLDFKFDFICLSESRILKDIDPKIDINIKGYQDPVETPTEANKGGVLIYIKEGIDCKPRPDLNIYKHRELESYFVEMDSKNSTNNIIGVIYRHPSMDADLFNTEY